MKSACRKYCLEAIQLSERLIKLAHDGNAGCDDDRCLVLFGIILDSASKLRLEAEKRLKSLEAANHFRSILDEGAFTSDAK